MKNVSSPSHVCLLPMKMISLVSGRRVACRIPAMDCFSFFNSKKKSCLSTCGNQVRSCRRPCPHTHVIAACDGGGPMISLPQSRCFLDAQWRCDRRKRTRSLFPYGKDMSAAAGCLRYAESATSSSTHLLGMRAGRVWLILSLDFYRRWCGWTLNEKVKLKKWQGHGLSADNTSNK